MDDTERIDSLLRDQDEALRVWYQRLNATGSDDLILTGGVRVTPERIRGIFERWFQRNRSRLQTLICGHLKFGKVGELGKDVGEAALVALIVKALATDDSLLIDPTATAVVLVCSHYLDALCQEVETREDS